MTESILAMFNIRFLGFVVFGVALLAVFFGWLKEKWR